jgi:hypothetical protein
VAGDYDVVAKVGFDLINRTLAALCNGELMSTLHVLDADSAEELFDLPLLRANPLAADTSEPDDGIDMGKIVPTDLLVPGTAAHPAVKVVGVRQTETLPT